ncbi:ly6/PLAUR domain-containing protein 6B [Prionailurus iriomotensis]
MLVTLFGHRPHHHWREEPDSRVLSEYVSFGLSHNQGQNAAPPSCSGCSCCPDLYLVRKLGIGQEHQLLQREASSGPLRHFQIASSVLPVKMQGIIITAIDGQKTNGAHKDTQYCLTVHHFTSHGRSTSITKKCASRSECHFVGCHHSRDSEHTECRSCCEGMICNVELPTNHTNAVFAVMHAQRTSGSSAPTLYLPVLAWVSVPLLT